MIDTIDKVLLLGVHKIKICKISERIVMPLSIQWLTQEWGGKWYCVKIHAQESANSVWIHWTDMFYWQGTIIRAKNARTLHRTNACRSETLTAVMKYNFGFHYFTLYETLSLFCLILTITKRQILIYTT